MNNRLSQSFVVVALCLLAWFLGAYGSNSIIPAIHDPGKNNKIIAHERLNATLWHQSSGEYWAVTEQIYGLARRRLDEALADRNWSAMKQQKADFQHLPPAIMLDLDETVFRNTCYESRLIKHSREHSPEVFNAWCEEQKAGAVPGAVEFLQYAASKGVTVFYTSGRTRELESATRGNLEKLGCPLKTDLQTLLLDNGTSMHEQRERVAKNYRILLLLGDNLDDFVVGSKDSPENRCKLAEDHKEFWGKKWIILPNAMYGHWEAAFYGFDYGMPRSNMLIKKAKLLDECTPISD